ncbi:uncharacterized protein LOC123554862 [Mercenaria mercenaria]|uniref:uncharacterized protein LOC123554862 n=1 Tax=Mercenaria mercenaria TaxID=6596 RepID=UPI00234E5E69|nr:uncharacterized protein LOC123554862 [Mercenaria mercenaria]
MKFATAMLIFSNGLSIFLASNDSCGEQDLNAMMVRLRQLRTEFQNLKAEYANQININKEEIKLLKEQQANEIQDIKAELGNKTLQIAEQTQEIERLKGLFIEKNLTTMVAFVARQKELDYNCTGKVLFEIIVLNEGNAFNTSTSHFTAPFAGLYMFTAQLCFEYYYTFDFSIYSYTNNKTYGASRNVNYWDYECGSLTTTVKLATNEEVYVHIECQGTRQIGNIDDTLWTMFSGILLV